MTDKNTILPAEHMALTVARAQIERGDNPPVNTTAGPVRHAPGMTQSVSSPP
jgi:hypothetical protein